MLKHFLKSVRPSFGSRPRQQNTGRQGRPARRRSAWLQLETLEDRLAPSSVPAAPQFTISDVSGTQVSVSWKPVAGATSYAIDQWVNGAWKQIGTVGGNYTGCTVSNLSAGTTYYFDVGATNSAGTGWASYQSIITVDHPSAGGAYSAVRGSLFGPNGPSYTDVRQGAVGDCWLEASLAEVAAREPSVIRNMFTYLGSENENGATVGLYSVSLYDNSGNAHSIVVDTELPSGGNLYDHPANGVLWAALAEKAYAQANGLGYVSTGSVGSDSYDALNGGYGSWALQAITGQPASDYSINPSNIAAGWNAGEFIVIGTPSHPASPYIVGDHYYAVVGYNPSSSLPFEVYNPWGSDSSGWVMDYSTGYEVYGLFYANAAFLSQNFDGQSLGVGGGSDSGGTGGAGVGGSFQVSTTSSGWAAGAQGSTSGPAAPAPGYTPAWASTGFAGTGTDSVAGTVWTHSGLSSVLATEGQQARAGSDALWAEVGDPDLAGGFLSQFSGGNAYEHAANGTWNYLAGDARMAV